MNEACDIVEDAGLCRCRSCGAAWHGPREAGPCDAIGPMGGALGAVVGLLRPRGFLGLILWSWVVFGSLAMVLAGALWAADRATRFVLAASGWGL